MNNAIVISELKNAGFANCENVNSSEYQIFKMVINAIDVINVWGYSYFRENTGMGSKVLQIVNKLTNN